jgi:xanthine dehydrogenase small subunit
MASPIRFICNDRIIETWEPGSSVVLDFLRNTQRLTGTKEGCREGDCGACTVLVGNLSQEDHHISYHSICSCLLPLGDIDGKHVVTIEGLNPTSDNPSGDNPTARNPVAHNPGGKENLNPIQEVFVEEGATQCGFCTPGFIVSLTYFFLTAEELSVEKAEEAVAGNICRCTGYTSIKRALELLVQRYRGMLAGTAERVPQLIEHGMIPSYFSDIPSRLAALGRTSAEEGATGKGHPRSPAGPESRPSEETWVAGGTDLYVQNPDSIIGSPIRLFSQKPELRGISIDETQCRIGAGTPVEEVKASHSLRTLFSNMDHYLELIASPPIRQRATVGGNIVNASPIGDLTILFLALDSVLVLEHNGSTRKVKLKDFFLDYKKLDLRNGEIVKEVVFPLPSSHTHFTFEKVSRRRHLDIASVNSAMMIEVGPAETREKPAASTSEGGGRSDTFGVTATQRIAGVHLSAGGVGPVPLFLGRSVASLTGKPVSAPIIQEAAEEALQEISPISDVRGSAQYKRLLLRQLIYAHFVTLFPETIKAEELL